MAKQIYGFIAPGGHIIINHSTLGVVFKIMCVFSCKIQSALHGTASVFNPPLKFRSLVYKISSGLPVYLYLFRRYRIIDQPYPMRTFRPPSLSQNFVNTRPSPWFGFNVKL